TAAAVGREAMIEIPLELFRKFEAFEAENAELRTTLIDTCQKLGQLKGESERDKAQLTTQAERLKEAEELLMEVGNIKPSTNAYGGAEHWSIRYGLIKRIKAFCPPATPPPGSQEGIDLTKSRADMTQDFGGDYGRGWYDGRAQGFKDARAIIQTEAGKDKP